MSRRGYTSRPPVPEEREINRLHVEAVKKQKDAAEAAAASKRKRKEKHDKACKIAHAEGKPRPTMPESTEEEDPRVVSSTFRMTTRQRRARVPRQSIEGLATRMCQ